MVTPRRQLLPSRFLCRGLFFSGNLKLDCGDRGQECVGDCIFVYRSFQYRIRTCSCRQSKAGAKGLAASRVDGPEATSKVLRSQVVNRIEGTSFLIQVLYRAKWCVASLTVVLYGERLPLRQDKLGSRWAQ